MCVYMCVCKIFSQTRDSKERLAWVVIWRLQVNKILQDLESYGGSIHETKGSSQRKVHVCLRCREMQPLVSPHQESVSWGDHDVIFSRTFFQLIQEQISHQSVIAQSQPIRIHREDQWSLVTAGSGQLHGIPIKY